jgi:hypothetical protein
MQREKELEEQRFKFEQEKAKFELDLAKKKQEIFSLGEQVSRRASLEPKEENSQFTSNKHLDFPYKNQLQQPQHQKIVDKPTPKQRSNQLKFDHHDSDTLLPTIRDFGQEYIFSPQSASIKSKQRSQFTMNNKLQKAQNSLFDDSEEQSELKRQEAPRRREFPNSTPSSPSTSILQNENEWETIVSGKTLRNRTNAKHSDIEDIAIATQNARNQLAQLQKLMQSLHNMAQGKYEQEIRQFSDEVTALETELRALAPTRSEVTAKGNNSVAARQRLTEKIKGQAVWSQQALNIEKEMKQTLTLLKTNQFDSTMGTQTKNWNNFRKVVQLEREVQAKPNLYTFSSSTIQESSPPRERQQRSNHARTKPESNSIYDDFDFDPEKLKKQLDSDQRKANQNNYIYLDRMQQRTPIDLSSQAAPDFSTFAKK